MENLSIFDLMSQEEASKFKPEEPKKPQLTGVLKSETQHNREKGKYAEGWEEAIGNNEVPNTDKESVSKTSKASKVKVDKTPEYLSYRKMFCYAREQFIIDDPSLSLEEIRKYFEKSFPELSRSRVTLSYKPPVIPKSKKANGQDSEGLFEENGEELFGYVFVDEQKGTHKGSSLPVLERTFTSWEELTKHQTVKNLLIGRDGLYEIRFLPHGLFCVKVEDQFNPQGEVASEGYELYVPKIPYELLTEALTLFKELSLRKKPVEALVRFYFDGDSYFMWVPLQVVKRKTVDLIKNIQDKTIEDQYIRVLEMHSHNTMSAFFSPEDDEDEVATGFYALVGKAHQEVPSIRMRYSCGGHYREIDYRGLFESPGSLPLCSFKQNVLTKWNERILIGREIEEDGGNANS